MRELRVDYGQASIVKSNMSMSLSYLEDEISKINSAINEIESLNRSYGKTSTILNELYDQKKKAQQSYDEMQEFNEKFSKFISNVKTTDTELAKKFTSDVKTYCKKNNIEITSELDAFLDKVQVALDLAGWLPIVGDVADGINAAISLCRGNYLEALICVVAMLPFGDMVKSLKYADEAKGILKYGDEFLKGVKTVAKEGSEKLSKQMSKVIKSGKLDNVIASMDAGKHYIVKMRDGTVTAIEKTGLPEKIRVCLGNGCFIAGTLVTTRSGLKPIEEIKIGDYVLSRNEETGENSYKKVTDTLVRSTQEICTIELENGNIKLTTGHLFMVKDKWWKAAVELIVGDILVTSDGKEQVVKSIRIEEKGYPVTTYNLTVEDNHTFFISSERILTHNTTKLLKKCDYTKEISESITEGVSNPKKINYKNIDDFIAENKNFDEVLDDYAKIYADKINSNVDWSWNKSIHGGERLTIKQKRLIKELAIEKGYIPNVKVKKVDGMRYGFADFASAGVVKETKYLPEEMWKLSDSEQFKWLDEKIGGHVNGYTWHHTEIPGKMELVPTGIHNIITHNGGRTKGMWADAPR